MLNGIRSRLGPAARGSIYSMGIRVYYVGLQFLITLVLARQLGAEAFGEYAFVMSLVMLISIPAAAGLPKLLVRQTAYYDQSRDFAKLKGIVIFGNLITLVTFLIVAVAFLVGRALMGWGGDQIYVWGLLLIPLLALGRSRGAVVQGFRRVLLGQLPENILTPTVFLLLMMVFWYGIGLTPTSENAMLLHLLGAMVAFVCGVAILLRVLPAEVQRSSAEFHVKTWIGFLIPFSLIAGVQVFNSQIGLIMLKGLGETAEVGLYKVATQLALVATFPLTALSTALSPFLAKSFAAADTRRLHILALRSSQFAFLFSLLVAGILFLFGEWILVLAFGGEFARAFAPLSFLLVGQVFNGLTGSLFPLLKMIGKERIFTLTFMVTSLLNLLLCVLLIPLWGVSGAAIASMIAMISLNLSLAIYALRVHGINCFPFRFKS